MKQELEGILFEKYPSFFADRSKPPTHSLMCFGCECDDGWFDILDNMCWLIQNHINNGFWKHEEPYKFSQIKEKFAGLRVYDKGNDEYIQGVIDMAESMSYRTCEVCGQKGTVCNSGIWLKTLCEPHSSELGYTKKEKEIC